MQKITLQAEYKRFFIQIKEQIKSSQAKAALSVNASLIHLYWTIGKLIVEKQSQYNWGTGVIEQLSLDLKTEFPNTSGFSPRNLHDTRRFYLFYNSEIMRQAVALFDIQTVSQRMGLNQTPVPESQLFEDENTILRQAVAQIP